MKKRAIDFFKYAISIGLIFYPFIVFILLKHHFSYRLLGLFLIAVVLLNFIRMHHVILLIAGLVLSALLCFFQNELFLKFYPVLMNVLIFATFFLSLFKTPMIEIFARKMKQEITPEVLKYTRQWTVIWSAFLFTNTIVSLATVFMPINIWTIYNGLISYLLIGLLIVSEWIIRKRKQHVHAS